MVSVALYGACDILKHFAKEVQAPIFSPVSQVRVISSVVLVCCSMYGTFVFAAPWYCSCVCSCVCVCV